MVSQWNAEFANLHARYLNPHDRRTLDLVRQAGIPDLAIGDVALATAFGPADRPTFTFDWKKLVAPLLEAVVANLPLTDAQKQHIDALIESLL